MRQTWKANETVTSMALQRYWASATRERGKDGGDGKRKDVDSALPGDFSFWAALKIAFTGERGAASAKEPDASRRRGADRPDG